VKEQGFIFGKFRTWDVVQSIQITFPFPTSLLAL